MCSAKANVRFTPNSDRESELRRCAKKARKYEVTSAATPSQIVSQLAYNPRVIAGGAWQN